MSSSVLMPWGMFFLSAAVIVVAGTKLSYYGDRIASLTGLGRLWIGVVLMAVATSLPEVFTTMSAGYFDAPELAAGDLFGAGMTNMLTLGLIDQIHRGKSVWQQAAFENTLVAALAIILTALASFFVLFRFGVEHMGIGLGSLLLLLVYVLGIRLVFRQEDVKRRHQEMQKLAEAREEDHVAKRLALRQASLGFGAAALALLASAPLLARAGQQIAEYRIRRQRERQRLALEAQQQALENERQRIAQDMHDDIGSSLSALSLLSEIAQYKQSPEDLKADIEKINQSSRDLSDKIREVIWTVSASNDTLANLISYIHRHAIELFESTNVECFVNLPEIFPELAVGGEQRRTLFLACKEAMNNITKYAGATRVILDFEINDNKLEIRILDDGKGFDPALLERSSGNGLRNMQSRMRDIQGSCHISTGPRGTQVHFSMGLLQPSKKRRI